MKEPTASLAHVLGALTYGVLAREDSPVPLEVVVLGTYHAPAMFLNPE